MKRDFYTHFPYSTISDRSSVLPLGLLSPVFQGNSVSEGAQHFVQINSIADAKDSVDALKRPYSSMY